MSVLTQLTVPGEARPLKIAPKAIYTSSYFGLAMVRYLQYKSKSVEIICISEMFKNEDTLSFIAYVRWLRVDRLANSLHARLRQIVTLTVGLLFNLQHLMISNINLHYVYIPYTPIMLMLIYLI